MSVFRDTLIAVDTVSSNTEFYIEVHIVDIHIHVSFTQSDKVTVELYSGLNANLIFIFFFRGGNTFQLITLNILHHVYTEI